MDLLWNWYLLRLDIYIMNRLLNWGHVAVEWRSPLKVTTMFTADIYRQEIQALLSHGAFEIFKYVLFSQSLQDPKGMSFSLHVCKVPKWNDTDQPEKSWSPSTVLSMHWKELMVRWLSCVKGNRGSCCTVLYGSYWARRIWCKKAGVLVESLDRAVWRLFCWSWL